MRNAHCGMAYKLAGFMTAQTTDCERRILMALRLRAVVMAYEPSFRVDESQFFCCECD